MATQGKPSSLTAILFDKSICNKVTVFENDDEGVSEEQIKIKLEGRIMSGATMEMVRSNLHRELDTIFNGMFRAEGEVAAARAAEHEHWVQADMFDTM